MKKKVCLEKKELLLSKDQNLQLLKLVEAKSLITKNLELVSFGEVIGVFQNPCSISSWDKVQNIGCVKKSS